jgi:hypothetical protein
MLLEKCWRSHLRGYLSMEESFTRLVFYKKNPVKGPKGPVIDVQHSAIYCSLQRQGHLGSLSSSKMYYFWAKYRAENLSLKVEQSVLFPFCQHPRFTAVQQGRVDQCLVNR